MRKSLLEGGQPLLSCLVCRWSINSNTGGAVHHNSSTLFFTESSFKEKIPLMFQYKSNFPILALEMQQCVCNCHTCQLQYCCAEGHELCSSSAACLMSRVFVPLISVTVSQHRGEFGYWCSFSAFGVERVTVRILFHLLRPFACPFIISFYIYIY